MWHTIHTIGKTSNEISKPAYAMITRVVFVCSAASCTELMGINIKLRDGEALAFKETYTGLSLLRNDKVDFNSPIDFDQDKKIRNITSLRSK